MKTFEELKVCMKNKLLSIGEATSKKKYNIKYF